MVESMLTFAAALTASIGALPAQAAAPLDTVEIREWNVPWESTRPRDPDVHPSGQIWFVGQRGNYVGVLDPASGEFRRHELPERALPHNIIVGPDGDLFYAGNGDAHIGRIDAETGEVIRRYDIEGVRDPHTLIFSEGGALWFTAQGANRIGRLNIETGEYQLVTPERERSRPYGIVMQGETPWIALFGTNRLARIDPATMALQEFDLPWEDARARRLAVSSDAMVWYVDYARGTIGRLDPSTGDAREWPTPGGVESRPYAMTVDARDRLWFVETGPEPNRLVAFDPATESFVEQAEIPSGGGAIRHMVYDETTGSIWFGTDANTVGRAKIRF